jgi:hypothetical protein
VGIAGVLRQGDAPGALCNGGLLVTSGQVAEGFRDGPGILGRLGVAQFALGGGRGVQGLEGALEVAGGGFDLAGHLLSSHLEFRWFGTAGARAKIRHCLFEDA